MKTATATTNFFCAGCSAHVERGTLFVWGPWGSRTRYCVPCASNGKHTAKKIQTEEIPTVERKSIRLSPEQQNVCNWAVTGTGNALLEAVAGSGKTSTLESVCRAILDADSTKKIVYLVFNARNAEEARKRMPVSVDTSTFHGACYTTLKRYLGLRNKPDGSKLRKCLRAMVENDVVDADEAAKVGNAAIKLVELAKRHGIGAIVPDLEETWYSLMARYAVQPDAGGAAAERLTVAIARQLLDVSNKTLDSVDFDDMLYLTLKFNLTLTKYDFVLVDEAQDSNPVRLAILRLLLAENGRVLAVGDRRQAIYGFTGAENDAMDRIASDFDAVSLPLTVNYRCDRAIISAAQAFCPEITPCDTAEAGIVETVDRLALTDFAATDAVICRNNAPLVALAYKMLSKGIACVVLGRDIGADLVATVERLASGNNSISDLLDSLDTWYAREIARWTARGDTAKLQTTEDKYSSIIAAIDALTEANRTVSGLIARITEIFGEAENDAKNGVVRTTLATIHKAKGLEYDTVYILDPHRMPSPYARLDWQIEQEGNLHYVAITRARHTLRYVSAEGIGN